MLEHRDLTDRVIGLAIEVHRHTGPGLLESFYRECLCLELAGAGIAAQSEVVVPAFYKGLSIPMGFRADIVVENRVIVEIKAAADLVPAHDSQLITYLRMSQIRVGLLMNFRVPRLKDGLKRFIV